jgi:hypothetical protein
LFYQRSVSFTCAVKGLNAQDGGAPATELVAGTGRGGGGCGRAPNGEGGRLERIRVGEEDQFLLNSIKCRLQFYSLAAATK